MNYLETIFSTQTLPPESIEILIAELGEVGYESFVEDFGELRAYIPEEHFNRNDLDKVIRPRFPNITFHSKPIPRENWNKTWESHYTPIEVDDFCYIHAPFHLPNPKFPVNIQIEPKMSFGTGHHQTTRLMIQAMRRIDFKSKMVLDIGCGTGVLAIVATKLGARIVDAIDTDEWAVENSVENAKLNNVANISVIHGDSRAIVKTYDVILANINRNVLLNDMSIYSQHVKKGGSLVLSGFYSFDENILIEEAKKWNLTLKTSLRNEGWDCLHLIKN